MIVVLIAKLIKTKFAKHRFTFCFRYMYSWQHEVTRLFSYHCASVARIFGNLKSLSSFDIIVYIEIEKNAHGDLWLLTSFDLIEFVFADIRRP